MANWSSTEVTLTGCSNSITDANKFITDLIDSEWLDSRSLADGDSVADRSLFSGMEIHDYQKDDSIITIVGSGRWCSPSGFFILVAKKFYLELEYHDAEPGCAFYHWVTVNEDGLEENNEYDYNSIERINWQGTEYFKEDLDCWYWDDDNDELDTDIENLINHFDIKRPDIDLYKNLKET